MKKIAKKQNKITIAIHILILIIITIMICASSYLKIFFSNETIEEFIFYLSNGVSNGDMGIYVVAIQMCLPFFIVGIFALIALFYDVSFGKKIKLAIRNKSFQIYPINLIVNNKTLFTIIYLIIALLIAIFNLKIFDFFKNNMIKTSFIEDNYVMNKEDITFNEKRNLIYIYVESLETTFFTKEQGGSWDHEVMPELYNLLYEDDSVFFSPDDTAKGLQYQYGATWTTAALASTVTGLPFKTPIGANRYHSKNFMNGAYALGDLLKDNGYYNELISGAKTNFGGVEELFTRHGEYAIIDFNSLDKFGLTANSSDEGVWGFNDRYLFNIAKQRVLEASKKDQPFNITMITIDTHPNDGFVGEYTVKEHDEQFDNVYATTSDLLYDFVKWVQQQDFYENTTIVIVGDHLNMQSEYFKGRDENRYIYNCFINSAVEPTSTQNRLAMSIDMYPSTVAAIGGQIKDDKLGLGTNLFSDKKTIAEENGVGFVNAELEKKSEFYNTMILGSDYFEMMVKKDSEDGVDGGND